MDKKRLDSFYFFCIRIAMRNAADHQLMKVREATAYRCQLREGASIAWLSGVVGVPNVLLELFYPECS